ncbi:MAG: 2-oxo acid dehydrogenase subunit E2, partial [Bryobacteraceae bacterium]
MEDEIQQSLRHDPRTVDPSWRELLQRAPVTAAPPPPAAPKTELSIEGELAPLRGAAARIAQNMNASLWVPTATSQRVIPVKVVDENRRIILEHRSLLGGSKISFTHLIAWAVVQALKHFPTLNHA